MCRGVSRIRPFAHKNVPLPTITLRLSADQSSGANDGQYGNSGKARRSLTSLETKLVHHCN